MRVIQQIATRIGESLLKIGGGDSKIVGAGLTTANYLGLIGKDFVVSYNRGKVHKDLHRMDEDDPLIKSALDMIVFRALGMEDPSLDSFEVSVARNDDEDEVKLSDSELKRANREISRLNKRLKIQPEAPQIVRRFVKFGNDTDEILWDWSSLDIAGLKCLPEQTVWPNKDDRGNILPGYYQKPENIVTKQDAIQFKPYELLWFRFGENDGGIGTPHLKCARKEWIRLNLALDSTARARLIRAFCKFVHHVPINTDWTPQEAKDQVKLYKDSMAVRRPFDQTDEVLTAESNPLDVATDFFITDDGSKRGGVDILDPENAQLQNIKDIEHFTDRLIAATMVPKRYFPFEGSTPKLSEGGGSAEDKHFACLLVYCQNILKQGLSQLYDYQLTVKGINTEAIRYVWRMAEINTTDQLRYAQTQLSLAKSMEILFAQYPELREKLDIMLTEYTRMSDASKRELRGIKVKELPAPVAPVVDESGNGKSSNGKKSSDSRVTLPTVGSGGDRNQV